jgi:hypothetical protein
MESLGRSEKVTEFNLLYDFIARLSSFFHYTNLVYSWIETKLVTYIGSIV